jgi:hypothetical protein
LPKEDANKINDLENKKKEILQAYSRIVSSLFDGLGKSCQTLFYQSSILTFSLDKIDITKLWSNFKGDWDMLKQSIGAVKDQTTTASQALVKKGKR